MERLDLILMSAYGLPREFAKEQIAAGLVTVNGKIRKKPGEKFRDSDEVKYSGGKMKYVSRGGYKLEYALENFSVDLSGKTCLDAGASTGGFTDCMLQFGAKKVFSVDSGKEQLAECLRNDERVVSKEGVNIKDIKNTEICGVDFAAADLSFISIEKAAFYIAEAVKDGGLMIFLIKPQFEAGAHNLNKHGICKSLSVHKNVLSSVITHFCGLGLIPQGLLFSPVEGGDGNTEYLIKLQKRRS